MSRKKRRRPQKTAPATPFLKETPGKGSQTAESAQPEKRTKPAKNPVRSGTRAKRWPLVCGAVALALSALFFLEIMPYLKLRKEIPPLPDLTNKTESFVKELKAKDKMARAFRAGGDEVGELGKIYQANLYPKEAEKCFTAAARLSPGNPRWPYYLAYLKQQSAAVEGADQLLSRAAALSPDYLPAQLRSADLYFKSGKPAEAKTAYLKLVDDKAVGPYANLGLARIHLDAGEWEDAKASLEKALSLDPAFRPACRMLATVYDRLGQKTESEIFREKAGIERYAEAPDPWIEELASLCSSPQELMRLANIALQTSRYDRAYDLYKKAVELDPGNLENILQIGQMVFDSGNRDASLPLFEKALALRPGHEMALYYIGLIYYFQNRLEEADRTFRKLLDINPRSADGWTALGDVAFRRGDYRTAEDHYTTALAADPKASKVLYALGRVETAKGRPEGALRCFRKAADLDPRSADALFSIGAILAGQGKTEEAIEFYKKALGENPDFAVAHYNLANALSRLGRFAEARERYRRAIECDPEIAEAYLNLAGILSREGKPNEARENLRKALSLAGSQGNAELEKAIQAELQKLE